MQTAAWGQPGVLRQRIYLEFPKGNTRLKSVESDLIRDLNSSRQFAVASSYSDADEVLVAKGDVFVKGYESLNPRAGTLPRHGQPLKRGYVSVELKGKNGKTLWSYLATQRFGSTRIEQELARQIATKLIAASVKRKQ